MVVSVQHSAAPTEPKVSKKNALACCAFWTARGTESYMQHQLARLRVSQHCFLIQPQDSTVLGEPTLVARLASDKLFHIDGLVLGIPAKQRAHKFFK